MQEPKSDLAEFVGFTSDTSAAIQHLNDEASIYATVERRFHESERWRATLRISKDETDSRAPGCIATPLTVAGERIGTLGLAYQYSDAGFEAALRTLATAIAARIACVRSRSECERLAGELGRVEERSRVLSETMSDFVYALRTEPDGTLNREWTAGDIKRITGYTLDEIDARGGVMSIVHPDDRAIVIRRAYALTARRPYKSEYRIIDKQGKVRWIRYYTHPLTDEGADSETRIYGAAQDITEAVESEQALRASEEKYRDLVETISEVIYELDQNGVMSYVSPAVEHLLGYRPEELEGRHFREFVADDDLSRMVRDFERVLSGHGVSDEYRIRSRTGEARWIRTTTQPVFDGETLAGVRGVLVDVTDRVKAHEQLQAYRDQLELLVGQRTAELRAANERLALLSQRLMHAQENERRRIARELHDEIGQQLTALRITLQATKRARSAPAPQLDEAIRIAEHTLQQVRDLSLDLRPSLLDDLGLAPALRWYLDRQAQRTGLSIDFWSDPAHQRLRQQLEVACFRFAQEAVTNVIRHARASSVRVSLARRDRELVLTVEDDGVGFDVAATFRNAAKGSSIGLLGMRERVQLAGGRMEMSAAAGQGTIARARFPLSEDTATEGAAESQP